jgi:hypothetical protein
LKPQFILVDFENVQPKNLGLLRARPVKIEIKVFLGANQAKIPVATAQAIQAFGTDAEYIPIDGKGSNALDFHIAYYIGRLAVENPGSSFDIVSQDTGFDPLIRHLKTKGISCRRIKAIPETAAAKLPNSSSNPLTVDAVVDNLKKLQEKKPRTLAKLRNHIKTLSGKRLSEEGLDKLIGKLTTRGIIKDSDGKVHYELPS